MRIRSVFAAAVAVTLLAGPSSAATRGVRVGSFYFDDATPGDGKVVIDQGDQISFTFEGSSQHTATVDGWFTTGRRSPGETFTTGPLNRAGSFTLYCQVHGVGQHGATLIIRSTTSPSAAPTSAPPSPSPAASRTATPRPSRSPAAKPSPSPSPRRSSPGASAPSSSRPPSPTTAASPSVSAGPSATSSPTGSPSPSSRPEVSDGSSETGVASASAPAPAGEAARAKPLDDSGFDWKLPGLLVLILGAGAAAIAAGRRRNG